MRRSGLSSCRLWWQGYLWYAFRYGIGGKHTFWDQSGDEKTWSGNAYSMQTRVIRFDDALWRLVDFGDGGVAKDKVCYSELAVSMDEHLSL